MRSRGLFLSVLLGLISCAVGAWKTCNFQGKQKFGLPKFVAEISSQDTTKSHDVAPVNICGLASSSCYLDILYYINCGNDYSLYSIDANTGQIIGVHNVTNAVNANWEALALGPCQNSSKEYCFYMHDPSHRTVYVVREPQDPTACYNTTADVINYEYKPTDVFPRFSRTLFVTCDAKIHFFRQNPYGRSVALATLVDDGGTYIVKTSHLLDTPTVGLGPVAASLSYDCCELLVKTADKIYHFPVRDGCIVKEQMQLLPSVANPKCKSIAWALNQKGYYTALQEDPSPLYFSPRNKNVPESKFSLGTVVGKVPSSSVNRLSGMCASRVHPGIIYAITDTGSTDILIVQKFQAQLAGRIVTTLGTSSVNNVGWNGIVCAPCSSSPNGYCIFINDGFNALGDPANIMYVYPEPEDPYVITPINADSVSRSQYLYLGNKVNTQAMICGCDGRFYVMGVAINFGDMFNVFELVLVSPGQYAARVVATVKNPSITPGPVAASMSPCCDEFLVKYADLVKLYKVKNNDVASAFLKEPCDLPYIPEIDGRSVAFTADCNGYLTVERVRTPAKLKSYKRLPCCEKKTQFW